MKIVIEDGGCPTDIGTHQGSSDSLVRALVIVKGLDYKDAYQKVMAILKEGEQFKKNTVEIANLMESLGFKWVSAMSVGTGCKVHLRDGELPMGKLICSCSKRFVAVIDGVIHDVVDPSRDGTRCVYGYWELPN